MMNLSTLNLSNLRSSASTTLLAVTLGLAGLLGGCAADVGGAEGTLSWESFRAQAEQRADGSFILEGDLPVLDEAALMAIYEGRVAAIEGTAEGTPIGADSPALRAHQVEGTPALWGEAERQGLRYCVRGFDDGSTEGAMNAVGVKNAMAQAAWDWEQVADVRFLEVEDCAEALFEVAPASAEASYVAGSFFPSFPRESRVLDLNPSSLRFGEADPSLGGLSLRGILRHLLGFALGFTSEPAASSPERCAAEATARFESVMSYPYCAGPEERDLVITDADAEGAARLYGLPSAG